MRILTVQRRWWLELHRWLGALILLFLIIAGLSGSAIAFWRTIDAWLNPDWYQVEPKQYHSKPLIELSALVIERYPDSQVHGIILPQGQKDSVIFYLSGGISGIDEVFINPYDGSILGARDIDLISIDKVHLLPFLYRLHHNLAAGDIGKYTLGIAALLWLAMTIVGVILAWPGLKKEKWRKALSVKTSAGSARFMFDLHRAGGLLFSVFFIIIIWTGLWWNMDYVFRPVMTALLPTTPWYPDTVENISQHLIKANPDMAVAKALSVKPNAQAYYIRLLVNKQLFNVYLRQPDETGPYGRTHVFVGFDGAILSIEEPAKNKLGDSYAKWQLPLHTGQLLGLPGRFIWMLVGFIPLILSITGLYLWLRKYSNRQPKQ